MKITLIIFGIIFLVVGGLLYFVPTQAIQADTTTTEGGESDIRSSTASITVPVGIAYSSAIIGFILLILGLLIPGNVKTIQGPRGQRGVKGTRGIKGKSARHKKRSPKRKSRRATLPRGTSVTTTTRIKR
jgi:hypothetical protein